jgi:hypothetical protein
MYMDAHDDFLRFIEQLESLRKQKKLTPDVCARQEGETNTAPQGGAGGPSIALQTTPPNATTTGTNTTPTAETSVSSHP